MRNRSVLWLAFGAIGLWSHVPRSFADCGPAPITTAYSQNYLRAEAHYFYKTLSQYSSNSSDFGVQIPVYNVGIDMGTDASQSIDTTTLDWQNVSDSQASQFVQEEHQNVAAQIVDECGYRACKLAELSANSPDPNFLSAVLQFQGQVCLQGSVPTNGSGWPSGAQRPILTISPSTLSLTFLATSPPQDRVLTLINNSPDLKTIVANVAIDYGTNTNANGTVELLKKTGKPLPAGYPLKLSVKPGQSTQFTIRLHPPAGGATVTPKIVVSQVVNATVSSTTQLALLPPVTTKQLASALPATGQTTAYQPNDDGQLQYGADKGCVPDGTGKTCHDVGTDLTWEIKGQDPLNPAGGVYELLSGYPDSVWLWIDQMNAAKYGGYGDWRLPNVNELLSLVNYSAVHVNDALENSVLHLNLGQYWTSTSRGISPAGYAWTVETSEGLTNSVAGKGSGHYAVLVRGGSSRKGTPCTGGSC